MDNNNQEILHIGDIINVYDKIDPDELVTTAIVKLIEIEENNGVNYTWIYLVSNNDYLNTDFDPRIGNFFMVAEINDKCINKISNFTTN